MGISTNGIICFGVLFDDDFEFPWDDASGEGDIEEWWRKSKGYVPIAGAFDDQGNFLPGVNTLSPIVKEWLSHEHKWDEEHPMPFELVNYQSVDSPAYILAVPGTVLTASRGYPQKIDSQVLHTDPTCLALFVECLQKYDLMGELQHYLASYWG